MLTVQSFFDALTEKQQRFFTLELPVLIADWFTGRVMSRSKVNALAIALFHVRMVYPLRITVPIYRYMAITSYTEYWKRGQVISYTGTKDKPVSSWTYRKNGPWGRSREGLILRCDDFKSSQKYLLGDYVTIEQFIEDSIHFLAQRQRQRRPFTVF